jgi:hypothetical protein
LFPIAREELIGIRPAWSRWDRARQDWNMSTQRREERSTRATKFDRTELWTRSRLARCTDRAISEGNESPASPTRRFAAWLARPTARRDHWRAATNSLQSDSRNQKLVHIALERRTLCRLPSGGRCASAPRDLRTFTSLPCLRESVEPCRGFRLP